MSKYEKALNNVRKFEREHNMSKFGDVVPQPNSDTLQELVDKETEYQSLEEELGIDLITLFKALKDGIYSKQYGHLFVEHFVLKHDKELHCRPTYCAEIRFALKDYGKTWWIDKPKECED